MKTALVIAISLLFLLSAYLIYINNRWRFYPGGTCSWGTCYKSPTLQKYNYIVAEAVKNGDTSYCKKIDFELQVTDIIYHKDGTINKCIEDVTKKLQD